MANKEQDKQQVAASEEQLDDATAKQRKEAKKATEKAAAEQVEARNKEAAGERTAGEDAKATTPVNPDAPANALSEAQQRGYIGGESVEGRLAEEERQRRIRAGMVPTDEGA